MTDEEKYEKWFKSTPEYWCELTNELSVVIIAPKDNRESFLVSGEIED